MDNLITKKQITKIYGIGYSKIKVLIQTKRLQVVQTKTGERILKSSLKEWLEFEKDIKENYVNYKIAIEQIGSTWRQELNNINMLSEHGLLKVIVLEEDLTINLHRYFVSKDSLNEFECRLNEKYILEEEVCNILGLDICAIRSRKSRGSIPFIEFRKETYYLRSEVELILDLKNNYYTVPEVQKRLNLSRSQFRLCKESLNIIHKNRKNYILKEEVWEVEKQVDYLRANYYSYDEVLVRLNVNTIGATVSPKLEKIECPAIARGYFIKSNHLYNKEMIETYRLNRMGANAKNFEQILPNNPIHYLLQTVENLNIPEKLQDTYELFIKFAKFKINQSSANSREIIKLAEHLYKVLKNLTETLNDEIYKLETKQVNRLLLNEERYSYQRYMYMFLRYCNDKRICKYTIRKIDVPKMPEVRNLIEVYEFEIFIEYYNFNKDVSVHCENAMRNYEYASYWLYSMIHCSNAWRHSDIIDIPAITPEVVNINSMHELQNKNITDFEAKKIIYQLSNYELVISKTGMKRHFFCHKDLLIPMSIALIICEFHRRKMNQISLINTFSKNGDFSLVFSKKFFKQSVMLNSENFVFSSLKMNRTLMTYLFYEIQQRKGKSNSLFELIQKMRNHLTNVTKEYILNNFEGGIENISKHLFDRGEFGYIYDQLVEVLTHDRECEYTLTERTNLIVSIKEKYDILKLESAASFINEVESREIASNIDGKKRAVINEIRELDPEEAFEYIRRIYLREMPSKTKNMQCFSFPKCCKSSGEDSCTSCHYVIPNVYSISTIITDVQNSIERYKISNTNGQKKKEQRTLEHCLELYYQAIEEFGEEEVWSFIEGGEERLMEQFSLLDNM
ncbi:hypothetical protein [Bacillus cereus]|uniref:hypothetical protein n=1 Tax=Bacillus cereus TaxID=1396 RepID=UPI0013D624EA|nr:hypothetical protein [Bacillus cereus]